MTDYSGIYIEGEPILWPDAVLEKIEIGYEDFDVRIKEESGCTKLLCCSGYIGFQMIGFWDEVIIETARLFANHPFVDQCQNKVSQIAASGSEVRNAAGKHLLEINFIDGCKLWVCATRFSCEQCP